MEGLSQPLADISRKPRKTRVQVFQKFLFNPGINRVHASGNVLTSPESATGLNSCSMYKLGRVKITASRL